MSHREYTQNVKNWHASFNRKNTPWCLCQNEIMWNYICKKIVSARTYQNLEENRSIFTEIQSIFQKYADVIICKLKFWVRRPLWWRHELIEGQMRHEIISPIHTLSKYEKKIGVTLHPKELQWILYRHVFAHICYVLQELARTEIYVKRSIIPLLIVIKR